MENVRIKRRRRLPDQFVCEVPELARPYLSAPQSLILVASDGQQDVGFIFASVEDAMRTSDIEALFVVESYRMRGIASQLVTALETELIKRKCLVVTKLYEGADSAIIEPLFAQLGWKKPQKFMQRYHFHVPSFAPEWFKKIYPLPNDFTIVPWTQVTDMERRHIQHQLQQGTFPVIVYPLGEDASLIEPLNSLALRYKGTLIGWMVNHRMTPDTIRYAYFYVEDDFRHQGVSVRMLIDSIRLQQTSDIPKAVFEIRDARADERWKRFIMNRLAPYSQAISESRMVWKDLRIK